VSYLAYRSGFMAKAFGVLLTIASIGYLADAIGIVFIPGFTAVYASSRSWVKS
jgi:hypothetical protein